MMRLSSLKDIEDLYAMRGALKYGEGVTQMEHALQCATLAEAEGGSPSLIVAALLHDVGHLFGREEDVAAFDDGHETVGFRALGALFGDAVCAPVALHVSAKRYLCFKEAQYFQALSPASQRSLALQGGAFDASQAEAFERMPYWREAVALRRFDDAGKRDDISSRAFADFMPLMQGLVGGGAEF